MTYSSQRRTLLAAFGALALPSPLLFAAEATGEKAKIGASLAALEKTLDGRIGLFALDTGSGAQLAYRADERFPFCSTFKVIAAAAVLAKDMQAPGLLQRRIRYAQRDLVPYSPITEKHVGDGMTVAALCAAAIQYSDNTAGNLLIDLLGGSAAVTAFARAVGDMQFRLDRRETELNTAIPGDPRDTTTPKAMGQTLQRLALGDALASAQRTQLQDWMRGNTTGDSRIRAGIPSGWQAADKTGTGDYGSANDIAILWPPGRAPVVLAVYTTRHQKDAGARNDVIAQATRIAVDWLT
ncbi:MAG TPA: class A beta-lactamase [Oxalicibacterium sp.]|nr:class A beta-lactamase [Oxalicibacterium sp.]